MQVARTTGRPVFGRDITTTTTRPMFLTQMETISKWSASNRCKTWAADVVGPGCVKTRIRRPPPTNLISSHQDRTGPCAVGQP